MNLPALLLAALFAAAPLAAPPAAAAATAAASTAPAAPEPAPLERKENKWRLQFSGAAESAGEIVLAVRETGGKSFEVVVAIEGNDGENRVSSKVRRALDKALPWGWRVERDDGEDVLVKRRWFQSRFEITQLRSTVKGVRINFDQE